MMSRDVGDRPRAVLVPHPTCVALNSKLEIRSQTHKVETDSRHDLIVSTNDDVYAQNLERENPAFYVMYLASMFL